MDAGTQMDVRFISGVAGVVYGDHDVNKGQLDREVDGAGLYPRYVGSKVYKASAKQTEHSIESMGLDARFATLVSASREYTDPTVTEAEAAGGRYTGRAAGRLHSEGNAHFQSIEDSL